MGSVSGIQISDMDIVLENGISASLKTIYPAAPVNPAVLPTFLHSLNDTSASLHSLYDQAYTSNQEDILFNGYIVGMIWIGWILKIVDYYRKTQLLRWNLRSQSVHYFFSAQKTMHPATPFEARLESSQRSDLNKLHQYSPPPNCVQIKWANMWTGQRKLGRHEKQSWMRSLLTCVFTDCRSRCHSGLAEAQRRNPAPQSLS